MLRSALLGIAALVAFGTDAAAQDRDPEWITSLWTDSCPLEKAVAIDFVQAAAAPMSDLPPCTTIRGLRSGYRLYKDVEAYYAPRKSSTSMTATDYEQVIGLYGRPETLDAAPYRPIPTQVSGIIGRCGDADFMAGYCHDFEGRYLGMGEASVIGATPTRWTGEVERDRLDQLREMPLGAGRDYVLGRATEWLGVIRAGDTLAYSTRYGDVLFDDPSDPDSDLYALFRSPVTIFARLRAEPRELELKVWDVVQPAIEAEDEPLNPSDIHALACFRLTDWREDRWPVALIDADNDPDRPYVCVSVDRETYRGATDEMVSASTRGHGLLEPDWPD